MDYSKLQQFITVAIFLKFSLDRSESATFAVIEINR